MGGGSRPGCSFLYHWPAHQCLPRAGHGYAAVGTDPRQCPRPVRGRSLDGLPNRLGELGGCRQECFRIWGPDRVSAERCSCCCARKLRCTAIDPSRGLTSRCLHRSSVFFFASCTPRFPSRLGGKSLRLGLQERFQFYPVSALRGGRTAAFCRLQLVRREISCLRGFLVSV